VVAGRAIGVAAIVVLIATTASAQGEAATDNELFAGYCFAAATLMETFGKIAALQDCDGKDTVCLEKRELGAQTQRVYEAVYKRASDYLTARRLFHERRESLAWKGVQRATDNAAADFKACMDDGRGQNRDHQACARLRRCQDTSRLPL
jgi:hypothetical protein